MNALKRYRLKKGVSLTELAARLGVKKPYIAQIESGNRTVSAERALEIADELEISKDELFEPVRFRVKEV